MKQRVFVRVGKGAHGSTRGRTYVDVSKKVNHDALHNAQGPLPTVAFAIDLEIPDHLFAQAETVVAELKVTSSKAEIAATVPRV